jgi:hypothetical protein
LEHGTNEDNILNEERERCENRDEQEGCRNMSKVLSLPASVLPEDVVTGLQNHTRDPQRQQ